MYRHGGFEVDNLFEELSFGMAHPDYYFPLTEAGSDAKQYIPNVELPSWKSVVDGIWRGWSPPRTEPLPLAGWKIHISSTIVDADITLDRVAHACASFQIAFKHLVNEFYFAWLHQKYASRSQSGKFITIYPPDIKKAHELLEYLSLKFKDKSGPSILSDRRYKNSRVVHYRYGTFRKIIRFDPATGRRLYMIPDIGGTLIEDRRGPTFTLPPSVVDPFLSSIEPIENHPFSTLHRYRFEYAIRHSNGGGAYLAIDTRSNRRVFVKEARAHNGLTKDRSTAQERLRQEYKTLKNVYAKYPALCPEPLDYFAEWEHEFLVIEWIDGSTLHRWMLDNLPLIRFHTDLGDAKKYYADCIEFLNELDNQLSLLHSMGLRYGDLNPRNVIITPTYDIRLVDFEAVTSVEDLSVKMGTPGYMLSAELSDAGIDGDSYSLSAVARAMVFPVHSLMERNPRFWPRARRDANRIAPVPQNLWSFAARYMASADTFDIEEPYRCNEDLIVIARNWTVSLVNGILAMADVDNRHWLFPPSYQGLSYNTACFAYGSAGVLSTLQLLEVDIPDAFIERFLRDVQSSREERDGSLFFGSAGIACVLADLGQMEDARVLLANHEDGPIPGSLATGNTGYGFACLEFYGKTGDSEWLDRALAVAENIRSKTDTNDDILHDRSRIGLMHGHAGVALFLHATWALTGVRAYLEAGLLLLRRDLGSRLVLDDGSISITDKVGGRRALPYLSEGSAGVGVVSVLYQSECERIRFLDENLSGFSNDTFKLFTLNAGLYSGLCGLIYFRKELTQRGISNHDALLTMAQALDKYLIAIDPGYRVLGDCGRKYSADVWSGSSGIIRTLDALIRGPRFQYLPLSSEGVLKTWLRQTKSNE
jgi:tRNA A-37 threonylcarbamoyl transferase component Bud32